MTLKKAREIISDMSQDAITYTITWLETILLLIHKEGITKNTLSLADALYNTSKILRMAAHEQSKLDKSLYA